MKEIIDFPPNYKDIQKAFNLDKHIPIFCWDKVIYNPHNARINEDLIIHESAHSMRQEGNPDLWWDRYIKDNKFRLEEELVAYIAQFEFLKTKIKDKNKQVNIAMSIARDLSGDLYGNMITTDDAFSIIWKK